MLRTVVATSIVVVTACGSKAADKPTPTGPPYSPVVANGLRAIAADCKTTKQGTAEQLRCTSTTGLIEVSLESNRFLFLSIGLRSMIYPQAKGPLTYALKDVLGAAGAEELLAKAERLSLGERAELAIGTGKAVVVAGGTNPLAPEYKVEISWP